MLEADQGGYSIKNARGGCVDRAVQIATLGLIGVDSYIKSHEPGSPEIDPEASLALASNIALAILGFKPYLHLWGLTNRLPKPPSSPSSDTWKM